MTAHGLLHILPHADDRGVSLAATEKTLTLTTLKETGDIRTRAAAILAINHRTRQNKLQEYSIQ